MVWKAAAYLKRNRFGLFYFRRVIPPDVRTHFAFSEVSRSLRTGVPSAAGAIARRYAASLDLLFDRLRTVANEEKDDELRADLIVSIHFDEKTGSVKTFRTKMQPGEDGTARATHLLNAAREPVPGPTNSAAAAPNLFDEIDKYLDEHANGAWTPATALDIRGDFEQFKQVMGDMPVSSLGHEPLNRLRDVLLKLPANINKLPQTRGKSVDEILVLGLPPQSPANVRRKWSRLLSFFTWLENRGLVERNFARGKKPKGKGQSYEKFTQDDL